MADPDTNKDKLLSLHDLRPKTQEGKGEESAKQIRSILITHTGERPPEKLGEKMKVTFADLEVKKPQKEALLPPVEPKKQKKKVGLKPLQTEEERKKDINLRLEKVLAVVEKLSQNENQRPNSSQKELKARQILSPRTKQSKEEIKKYLEQILLPEIYEKVVLFGDSLIKSREIQQRFEQRPVNKDIFTFFHEFQYNVIDPLPRSLYCINSLGRVIYLESMGHLQQIDVMSEKQLPPYFLGIRMPLQYTPLIDTICDTKSCRVYTLSALWKLEAWSLEQNSTLPIKRVPMVNCEVAKDYIEVAYKTRFQLSKPTFLAMTECASQILVVNTSCVDGNIVFVDPISLSILKRIHLTFSDYEVPSEIKDAIDQLKGVLQAVTDVSKISVLGIMKKILSESDHVDVTYDEFIQKVSSECPDINPALLSDICRRIDINTTGYINLEETCAYLGDEGEKKTSNKSTITWPRWLIEESKVFNAKQVLAKIIEATEKQNMQPQNAFKIFDSENTGTIEAQDFSNVISKLCPEITLDETKLITRLADTHSNFHIRYEDFGKFLDKNALQSDAALEDAEKTLREPLIHKNDLTTMIRKCFDNNINLRELFKKEDKFKQGLIERNRLYQILGSLPLGYTPEDIYEIFRDSAIFDAHGNADYTIILQNDIYVLHENLRLQEEPQTQKAGEGQSSTYSPRKSILLAFDNSNYMQYSIIIESISDAMHDKSVDSRKVVVEDVIYLDDFDVVVYTTILPKSSNIYISHTIPLHVHSQAPRTSSILTGKQNDSHPEQAIEELAQEVLKYQFLATLKGHKNGYPPTICYVEETGCLLSGEKNEKEISTTGQLATEAQKSRLYAPNVHPKVRVEKATREQIYADYTLRQQTLASQQSRMTEILIWNLQQHLVHIQQGKYPITILPARRFDAHTASILDIAYMPAAQLIATCSTDQTIRLFDPISSSVSLTGPLQIPIVQTKPGYYDYLPQETTNSNRSFREIKRINIAPTTCYKLQVLELTANAPSRQETENSKKTEAAAGSIEWLVALKLTPPQAVGMKKQSLGIISGYGMERVKLRVPAIRVDDPVPEEVYQDCESEIQERRKKAVILFQSVLPYNLEHLQANVALQTAQMNKLADLFKEAMLNRTNGKYMSQKPLKEVFHILLEIPERKKYGNLIRQKGRNLILSVSEVYFYLKKYFQIHPTNLSQVMFAKCVKSFKEDHSKTLIEGIRKWQSEALNVYAGYIRKYGISEDIMQFAEAPNNYLSKAQLIKYLKSINLKLEEKQFEEVVNEIDASNSNRVSLQQLQQFFSDEIKHFNMMKFRKPNPNIEAIREKIIPYKKLRLHEAFGVADEFGDGYISKKQFLDSFTRAGLSIDLEILNYCFEMASEKFMPSDTEKIISITSFLREVLTEKESKELKEMISTLGKISSSLTYRDIDLELLFASEHLSKLDLTAIPEKLVDYLEKNEFISRLKFLNLTELLDSEITKIANYLAVKQINKDKQLAVPIIYLKDYLHHIKHLPSAARKNAASLENLLTVMCGKLLLNETRFRKQCEEIAEIIDGSITPIDLRSVLLANGIIDKHAGLFVEKLTDLKSINLNELLTRMKNEVILHYKTKYNKAYSIPGQSDAEIPQINFLDGLREALMENRQGIRISPDQLINKCKIFDKLGNDRIKLFHMLNVIKHNLVGIEEMTLAGIQFELTINHPDEYIDYKEFFNTFSIVEDSIIASPVKDPKKEKMLKEYDEILSRILAITVNQKASLLKACEAFDPNHNNRINKEQMQKALGWLGVNLNESEIDCLFKMSPKDFSTEELLYKELIELVTFSEKVVPYYDRQQWVNARKDITNQEHWKILADNLSQIEFLIRKEMPERKHIFPAETFRICLTEANISLTPDEIDAVTSYAIKGSLKEIINIASSQEGEKLINLTAFSQSLSQFLRGSPDHRGDSSPYRRSLTYKSPDKAKSLIVKKESDLINKIRSYFQNIGISFFDYFSVELPDCKEKKEQKITRKQIIDAIKVLKIPLSLQQQRLLLQSEDPTNENNIYVWPFCNRYEPIDAIRKRRDKALEKLAEIVIIKQIPMDFRFDEFAKQSLGYLSQAELEDLFKGLNLGLSGFEIDLLTDYLILQKDVGVSKDEFNEKISTKMASLRDYVLTKIKREMLLELHKRVPCQVNNFEDSLKEKFVDYDYNQNGRAPIDALPKVLENLRMTHKSYSEIKLLFEICGLNVYDIQDFDYASFCTTIRILIEEELKNRDDVCKKIIEKLHKVMLKRNMSVFDIYCQFDVLQGDGIGKLEMMAGLQSLGIDQAQEDVICLWNAIKDKYSEGEQISYHSLLKVFNEYKFVELTEEEAPVSLSGADFCKKLKELKMDLEIFFSLLAKNTGNKITKLEFMSVCKKIGVDMSIEQLEKVFIMGEDVKTHIVTRESFAKSIGESSKLEKRLYKIYRNILKKSEKTKTDWEKLFRIEREQQLKEDKMKQKKKEQKKESKKVFGKKNGKKKKLKKAPEKQINQRGLINCIRNLRFGLKLESIELAIKHIKFNSNNFIEVEEFIKQIKDWVEKYEKEQETQGTKEKSFLRKIVEAMANIGTTIETIYGDLDKDQDGAIDLKEFNEMIIKFDMEITKRESTKIFEGLTGGADEKLQLALFKQKLRKIEPGQYEEESEDERDEKLTKEEECDILFKKIKEKLNEKKANIQNMMLKLKIDPGSKINIEELFPIKPEVCAAKELGKLFDILELVLSKKEYEILDREIKKAFGTNAYSFQNLADFMTRRQLNYNEFFTGVYNPGILICLQAIAKVLKRNMIKYPIAFNLLSRNKGAYTKKIDFLNGIEGMLLGLSKEDILELFSYMDKNQSGTITPKEFIQAITGASQETMPLQSVNNAKGGNTKYQPSIQSMQIIQALKKLGDICEKRGYTLREIGNIFDLHGTGILTKAELTSVFREQKIEIGLSDVRMLTEFFASIGDGLVYITDLMGKIQEILNQGTDGLYSIKQATPIIKKIIREIEGDLSIFSDELLKYEKILEDDHFKNNPVIYGELIGKSGIEKHNFYKLLVRFNIFLSEDEKAIINSAFGFSVLPNMLDTHMLLNILESFPPIITTAETKFTLEWERRIYRKIGSYLKSQGKTIADCFSASEIDEKGEITQEHFTLSMKNLPLDLTAKEYEALLAMNPLTKENKISVKEFAKRFYDTYLLDTQSLSAASMSKDREIMTVLKVIKKMKEKEGFNCERAFRELDKKGIGFLTVTGLQFGLREIFDIRLNRDDFLVVLRYMDVNDDGMVTQREFSKFYNDLPPMLTSQLENKESFRRGTKELTLTIIFDSLLSWLKEKNLSLLAVFEQMGMRQTGYMTIIDFINLVRTIGYNLSEKDAFKLFAEEPNFNGKISFKTLIKYAKAAADRRGDNYFEEGTEEETLKLPDKAIETVVSTLNSTNNSYKTFFENYDFDKDGLLTPKEFRESLKALRILGANSSKNQIERLLILFAVEKNQQTCIPIEKIQEFLQLFNSNAYFTQNHAGTDEILVSEDMFVMIVQHFDGLSVFINNSALLFEDSQYIATHRSQLTTRGCSLAANQRYLDYILQKVNVLAINLKDTLGWLSSFALQVIKNSAHSSLIDPKFSKLLLPSNDITVLDIVNTYKIPSIDPTSFVPDQKSAQELPCGCTFYKGIIKESKVPVRIFVYTSKILNKQNLDGKVYWRHLEMELAAQMLLYSKDPELTFKIIGKYEKKSEIGEYSVDMCVVFEDIPNSEYISLSDFLAVNGGLLQMPLLRGTETALYIAKMWSLDVLNLLSILHESGFVMRTLNPSHLYLNRNTSRIKLGHFRGIGRIDSFGKVSMCPDASIHSAQAKTPEKMYDDPYLAPEHIFRGFAEHTVSIDLWSFGSILYSILIGTKPPSYFGEYKIWKLSTKTYKDKPFTFPLIEPASQSFVYDPVSAVEIDVENGKILVNSVREDQSPQEIIQQILKIGKKKILNTLSALDLQSYSGIVQGKGWLSQFGKLGDDLSDQALGKDIWKPTKKKGKETQAQIIETLSKGAIGTNATGGVREQSSLGLLFDIIACCLDVSPQKRPSLQGLMNSPLFALDKYEKNSALKFAEYMFLYKSPNLCVTTAITTTLRSLCLTVLKSSSNIVNKIESELLKTIALITERVQSICTENTIKTHNDPLILTEIASFHAPLAKQIIEDKVVDMLIFLCHHYTKNFESTVKKEPVKENEEKESLYKKSKRKTEEELKRRDQQNSLLTKGKEGLEALFPSEEDKLLGSSTAIKKVHFADSLIEEARKEKEEEEKNKEKKKSLVIKFKTNNKVLKAVCELIQLLVLEMKYKESVFAPYVGKVLEYVVKLLIGEDFVCASELASLKNDSDANFYLLRTFCRNRENLTEQFILDDLDKLWYKTHHSIHIINYQTFWNYQTYLITLPLYHDVLGVNGQGTAKYQVVQDYIEASNRTAEIYSIFGKSANDLFAEFVVSEKRTSEYYAELLRMCQNIVILTDGSYGKAAKSSALGDICAMISIGSVDRVKAALDLRITKYLHSFLQYPDEEIRKSTLLIFFQFSRALADDAALSLQSADTTEIPLKEKDPKKKKPLKKKALPEVGKDLTLISYFNSNSAVKDPIDTKRYINFAYDLPAVHFQHNKLYLEALGKALETPIFASSLMRQIKALHETTDNKYVILKTLTNLFASEESIVRSLNSTLSDCYITLGRLMLSLSGKEKKPQEGTFSGDIKQVFVNLCELRNPKIISNLKNIPGMKGLLQEAGLKIPRLRGLNDIVAASEKILSMDNLSSATILPALNIPKFCKDLKACLMYCQGELEDEAISKAFRKSGDMLATVANVLWEEAQNPKTADKVNLINLICTIAEIWDWMGNEGLHMIIPELMHGKLLNWILDKLTSILSEFRRTGEEKPKEYLMESLYNQKKIRQIEQEHKFDNSPFMKLTIALQHIIAILLKRNDDKINKQLEDLNFGQIFGEHLILQYEFVKLTIDSQAERLGLLDIYVEQNYNRLCILGYLLSSHSSILKNQFLKSHFLEKMISEYIKDTREFSVKYNKIDIKFLAYRHSYPLRNESISIMSEIIKNKRNAYELYTELMQRIYRHQLIAHECATISLHKKAPELQVQTSLLFFSILLQAEDDISHAFKDEGVNVAINEILTQKIMLKKQFPLLAKYFHMC